MRRMSAVATVLIFGLLMPPLRALAQQQTEPTTKASTELKVDLSTPKAATKTFGQAMSEGNLEVVLEASIVNEEQVSDLETLVRLVIAFKNVKDVSIAKFGQAGEIVVDEQEGSLAEDMAKIDRAREVIEGDTAVLSSSELVSEIRLCQTGGQWRIDFSAPSDQKKMSEAVPIFNELAATAEELADEIAADKYKTAEEAKTALEQKVGAITQGPATTTAPSPPPPAGVSTEDEAEVAEPEPDSATQPSQE